MKKVALSLAGVLAAAAFAPEASALPVFARQTGMACNACHFQHFPLLNGFGRAFKASGFTLMGAQGKVEGDGLSIPNVVNGAVLTSMGYEKTNATRLVAGNPGVNMSGFPTGSSTGGFYVGAESGEASLFLGGRGSDYMGFLGEVTLGNGGANMDSLKTPILFDIAGGVRGGIVFFTTNGQGASYAFETMNTGANAIHSITNTVGFQGQYINAVSAQQYIGTNQQATGAAIVATGDMGFVNVTKFAAVGPDHQTGAAAFTALSATYLRVAYMTDLGGWDSGIGVQSWSGTSLNVVPGTGNPVGEMQSKATAIDAQMQGAAGTMPLGVYLTWAKAPVANAGDAPNAFNGGTADRSSINLAAELGVVPEKVTVGAAIREGKSGVAVGGSNNASDNAIFLTATYKLAQNELFRLSYVHQSGDYWNSTNTNAIGSSSYTLNLYALF